MQCYLSCESKLELLVGATSKLMILVQRPSPDCMLELNLGQITLHVRVWLVSPNYLYQGGLT